MVVLFVGGRRLICKINFYRFNSYTALSVVQKPSYSWTVQKPLKAYTEE